MKGEAEVWGTGRSRLMKNTRDRIKSFIILLWDHDVQEEGNED